MDARRMTGLRPHPGWFRLHRYRPANPPAARWFGRTRSSCSADRNGRAQLCIRPAVGRSDFWLRRKSRSVQAREIVAQPSWLRGGRASCPPQDGLAVASLPHWHCWWARPSRVLAKASRRRELPIKVRRREDATTHKFATANPSRGGRDAHSTAAEGKLYAPQFETRAAANALYYSTFVPHSSFGIRLPRRRLVRRRVIPNSPHNPVGQSMNSHGIPNRLDKCAPSAFTPKTSVA